MADIQDLDKLLPEPTEVKISGRVVKVYPGKLKALIKLQKAFSSFKSMNDEEKLNSLDEVIEALAKMIPDIKKDDFDVTIEQIPELVKIAFRVNAPQGKMSNEAKMDVTTEKKTLKEQLPTS